MARIPVIHSRASSNAPRLSARARPGVFGAQAAGATRQRAQQIGAAERDEARADVRAGRGDLRVAEARTLVARRTSADAADLSDSLDRVGSAALNIYRVTEERARRDQDIETERLVGEHGVATERSAADLQTEANADGSGYTDAVLAEFDRSSQKLLEGAGSRYQRRTMERALARQRVQIERTAGRWEISERQKKRRDDLDAVLAQRETAAATDPSSVQQTLAESHAVIDASNIRPTEKARLKRSTDRRFAKIAASSMMVDDPIGALVLLKDPVVSGALGADIVGVRQQIELSLDRQGRRERQEEREASDAAVKEVEDLIGDSALTPEVLQRYRGVLSATAYRTYSKSLRTGATSVTDVPTLVDLNNLIEDDPEEAQRRADVAVANKQITKTDYKSIMAAARAQARFVGSQGRTADRQQYVELRSQIGAATRPSSFDFTNKQAMRQVSAQMEFSKWDAENPKATFDQRQTKARELMQQYKPLEGTRVVPYGYKGSVEAMKATDLEAAQQKLREDARSRKLTRDAALRQQQIINKFREILRQRDAGKQRQ